MREFSATVVAKALVVAAIPVGAVGFVVPDPWAVASIVASLVLVVAAGAVWWLIVRTLGRWHRRHGTGEAGGPAATGGGSDYYYDPELVVYASRSVRRHQLMVSSTSRVRRAGMRRNVARIATLAASAQRSARREQLWWLVVGLAASIPIGVAINLATG
ncbi:hypothetical protein AB0B86_15625 [Micromonospora sp. NPDC049047]|uniref:hypothetical protein n=1 Tax=Micromonospora sp. NPDC049047 TaxID=3155645 RepID=UPI00340F3366